MVTSDPPGATAKRVSFIEPIYSLLDPDTTESSPDPVMTTIRISFKRFIDGQRKSSSKSGFTCIKTYNPVGCRNAKDRAYKIEGKPNSPDYRTWLPLLIPIRSRYERPYSKANVTVTEERMHANRINAMRRQSPSRKMLRIQPPGSCCRNGFALPTGGGQTSRSHYIRNAKEHQA